MNRLTPLAVVFLLASTPSFAPAAPKEAKTEAEQQSRRIFQNAEAHFRAGLFAEALAEYQGGYELTPLPGFLINIAQCQRRLGDLTLARATYRKFIMVAPDSPFVPQVKDLIAELDNLARDLEKTAALAEARPQTATTEQADDSSLGPARPIPTLAPASEASRPDLITEPVAAGEPSPAKTRWWLWGVVAGAAVVAATTAALVLRSPGTTTIHDGSLGTLRR